MEYLSFAWQILTHPRLSLSSRLMLMRFLWPTLRLKPFEVAQLAHQFNYLKATKKF